MLVYLVCLVRRSGKGATCETAGRAGWAEKAGLVYPAWLVPRQLDSAQAAA